MKRITNRKLRIGITLKVFENGQPSQTMTKHKKSQIFKEIDRIKFEKHPVKVFLRVSYGEGCNESIHQNKESLLKALEVYTEKKLLEYLELR